jgi:tRNA pseudouridine55 synthase
MDGLLIVDKPAGPSSHDVVLCARRALGESRIGHTGTLDPIATGVLPLVLGRATRLARFLAAADKSYDALIQLGTATDTYDSQGTPVRPGYTGPFPSREAIESALVQFAGPQLQRPPAFSAKKVGGRRSYALARAATRAPAPSGSSTALERPEAVSVTAHALELLTVQDGLIALRITCSSGFYVRSLANDLGERLGVGAHLSALRRMRSGDAGLDRAVPLEVVAHERDRAVDAIVPLGSMLASHPRLVLNPAGVRHARQGRELGRADAEHWTDAAPSTALNLHDGVSVVRLLDSSGDLIGLAVPKGCDLLHPSVILV